MVDEKEPLTKKERRQRQKRLERVRRQARNQVGREAPTVESVAAAGAAGGAEPSPAKGPGRPKRPDVTAADITGLKYFEKLKPLLERLHEIGCERDKAGNRELHYDELCLLLLLGLFNPVVDGLRGLQQASELEKVQQRLQVGRVSLGSVSEASRVFDAQWLKPILEELGQQLQPLGRDRRLADIPKTLTLVDGTLVDGTLVDGTLVDGTLVDGTLVDGTLLSALPLLIQAMGLKEQTGSGLVKWRLHAHFEVDRSVPTRIDVTPNGGGEHDERSVLERTLEADRLYVMDRGYAKFALFNQIVDKDSSYVCRLRDNSAYDVVEERSLTEADRAAGILSDQIVEIGQSGKPEARPDHKIRLVCVRCSQHTSRGKYGGGSTGPGSDGLLRIATNLLDVPAEIIGLIYRFRWTIELFFRFFKQILGCRHLFCSQNGIELQAYCAIIACMLLCLWTGRKPAKRTYEMVCYYFLGLASEAELMRHLAKLKQRDQAATANS